MLGNDQDARNNPTSFPGPFPWLQPRSQDLFPRNRAHDTVCSVGRVISHCRSTKVTILNLLGKLTSVYLEGRKPRKERVGGLVREKKRSFPIPLTLRVHYIRLNWKRAWFPFIQILFFLYIYVKHYLPGSLVLEPSLLCAFKVPVNMELNEILRGLKRG